MGPTEGCPILVPAPAARTNAQTWRINGSSVRLLSLWSSVIMTKNGRRTISRVLFPLPGGCHSSGTDIAARLERPTRGHWPGRPWHPPIWSCSGRGLPSLPRRRGNWWALTPPFHPYPGRTGAVCFLWHFPRVTPAGRYPAPCPLEPGLSSTGPAGSDKPVLLPFSPNGFASRPLQRRPGAGRLDHRLWKP